MLEFKPITPEDKATYERYLFDGKKRGCELSFTNLFLWGNQQATVFQNHMVLFSCFYGRYVYPYPVGTGDKKPVLDAIIADSKERGIPCYITGMDAADKQNLEELYPGMFRFHYKPDSFDYIYDINDLADLAGRKYHRKRNHYKRFCNAFPNYTLEPIGENNLSKVRQMIDTWYETKLQENPEGDYQMEKIAIERALIHYCQLGLEGLMLLDGENVLAITMGSQMNADTFDVHFEKARPDVTGAYAAINCEFARYIRDKYPHILFLDREEDMGIEGLRKAKQSYYPHHMQEKYQAVLLDN